MRRLSGLLVLVLLTAGCAAYRLIEPPRASVGRLSVDPQVRWSALEQGRLTLWTIDGLSLQRVLFLQAAEGEALIPARGSQAKVVRAGLTADEAMELLVDVLVADFGLQALETRNRRLRPFAHAEGFAFDFSFEHPNGLDQEGTAAGAVIGRRLYLIIYTGARTHYFARHRETVERLIGSVRIE